MKHRIIFGWAVKKRSFIKRLVKRSIKTALKAEGVNVPCEINVLLTDDEGIRQLNKDMRSIDSVTDVLSFPMFDIKEGAFNPEAVETDPSTGRVPLGDIALNLDRLKQQGEQLGHGMRRETAYLTIHSVLHLLGYDHLDEGERKAKMRSREEAIIKAIRTK
jgi:probable rRNA maturation factor